jgi:hypothetical protein
MPQSDIMTQTIPLRDGLPQDEELGASWDYRLAEGYAIQRSTSSDENAPWKTIAAGKDNITNGIDTNYYHLTPDPDHPGTVCETGEIDFGTTLFSTAQPTDGGTAAYFDPEISLQPDSTYFYRVVKVDATGTTPVAAPIAAHTDGSPAVMTKKSEDLGIVTLHVAVDPTVYDRSRTTYVIIGSSDPTVLVSGDKTLGEIKSLSNATVADATEWLSEQKQYTFDTKDIQITQPKNTAYTYVLARSFDDQRSFRVFGEPVHVSTSDKTLSDLLNVSTPDFPTPPFQIPVDKLANLRATLDFNTAKYLTGKAFISGFVSAQGACSQAYGLDQVPISASSHIFNWNLGCEDTSITNTPAGNYAINAGANLNLTNGMVSQEVQIPYEVTRIAPALTVTPSLTKVEYGNKNVVINIQNPITFGENRPMGLFTLKNVTTGKNVTEMYADNTSAQKFVLSWVKPGTYKFNLNYKADIGQGYFSDITLTVPTITVTKATPKITAQLADNNIPASTPAKVRVANPDLTNGVRPKGVLKLVNKANGSVLETMNTDGTSPQVFTHKFKAGKYNLQVKFVADAKQGLFQNIVIDVPTLTVK